MGIFAENATIMTFEAYSNENTRRYRRKMRELDDLKRKGWRVTGVTQNTFLGVSTTVTYTLERDP
jgi:hypothetical protein